MVRVAFSHQTQHFQADDLALRVRNNINHLTVGISGWLEAGKTTEKAEKKS